ncbi:hypothetical protein [Streptomyces sp. NPDC094468]|uniref:hypothetical protein n=1 Tax=Streptomyces sp. NPDC094468 TaxID=3366066 RepID=UPI00382FF13C
MAGALLLALCCGTAPPVAARAAVRAAPTVASAARPTAPATTVRLPTRAAASSSAQRSRTKAPAPASRHRHLAARAGGADAPTGGRRKPARPVGLRCGRRPGG